MDQKMEELATVMRAYTKFNSIMTAITTRRSEVWRSNADTAAASSSISKCCFELELTTTMG